jgi:hypothetical protein
VQGLRFHPLEEGQKAGKESFIFSQAQGNQKYCYPVTTTAGVATVTQFWTKEYESNIMCNLWKDFLAGGFLPF